MSSSSEQCVSGLADSTGLLFSKLRGTGGIGSTILRPPHAVVKTLVGSFGSWILQVFGRLGFEFEVLPDHRPRQRLDVQHHLSILKNANRAGRLAHRDGDGL